MATRIAINGFGRIGRCVLRALVEQDATDIQVVAVNDLTPPETLLHLLKVDSVHGRFRGDVSLSGNTLTAGRHTITLSNEKQPDQLSWDGVDIVYECTGHFTNRDGAALHLKNGSKRVLVSAPAKDADRTIVYGVNHTMLQADDRIISNASCTTNCLAPVAMVLDQTVGIKTGYMTTIHAYTGDQPTHDSPHRDLYRGRAASLSMIPTTTGAAKAIGLVLPQLAGKLEGSAVRVPTPNVSMVDLCFVPERATTADAVNAALRDAANGPLKGILSFETDPFVSIDYNHDPHSCCVAGPQTAVTTGGLVRVVSWYDNEWGFSNRMNDTARAIAALF
jgi:glyceraldehyde 3-phosphate dehydrogenase (phosphorylating)